MDMADKRDWARELAEKFVADGRPADGYHKTDEEWWDERRLARLLRRTWNKGFRAALRAAVEVQNGR
jgi:hypothetical protein